MDGLVRAKKEELAGVQGFLPESRGQNLALTVLYVTCSLDWGTREDRVDAVLASTAGTAYQFNMSGAQIPLQRWSR